MIKKILKSVLLFGFILFPVFSFAFENTFYPYVPVEINDGQHNVLQLTPKVNFLLNDTYKVISVYGGGIYPRLKNVFWSNDGLYFIRSCAGGSECSNINTSIETQGYIQTVLTCDIDNTYCENSPTSISIDQFVSNNNYSSPDYMILNDNQWNNTTLNMCLVYDDLDTQVCIPFDQLGLTGSKGFTYNPLPSQLGQSEDQISSYFTSSPFEGVPYVPIQETLPITDDDIVDYYEDNLVYNFNEDMCYIGTTDLSSNYESGITYYQGSGYTIYEFFEQLYGSSFKLSDLDTWLNSWLVNFDTFFNGNNRYSDGIPWYVLRYNGIGNLLIDKNNLDNPFLNNKSAYYFMASTIYDSYRGYDINPSSEDIAVYCYKKTGVSSDIEFNPPNGIKNNIGNWVDQKNKGKGVGFSGWSVIQGESWNGTPLDYFSGDNIVYTGFDSFFKTSFNRFAGVFQGLDPSDLVLGQIPSYIVGFLLLLILFRFLSH